MNQKGAVSEHETVWVLKDRATRVRIGPLRTEPHGIGVVTFVEGVALSAVVMTPGEARVIAETLQRYARELEGMRVAADDHSSDGATPFEDERLTPEQAELLCR